LCRIGKDLYGLDVDSAGKETWKDSYDDGMTPKEAIELDLSYGD
jgi:hypothetical protein